MPEKSLYERLGGAFAIAAVVDHFSDNVLANPLVGKKSKNSALREWSTNQTAARMPGLKFMRTLWVCSVSGGPFKYEGAGKPLGNAHKDLNITAQEFDEVAAELARTLAHFKIPKRETDEVMAAFNKQKPDVAVAVARAR
ncbi:MAG: group 1 truncated hemoglobin [Candidatus Thermoplasmatota archaeon]|jgi:hemoglobin